MSYDEANPFDKAEDELIRIMEKQKLDKYWKEHFKEPIETIYIVMKDGIGFKSTSNKEGVVSLSLGRLESWLKKRDYKISDIGIVMHNHLKPGDFSGGDKKSYRRLKKYGFNGKFMLYSHATNKTIEYKPKEKSNNKKIRSRKDNDNIREEINGNF